MKQSIQIKLLVLGLLIVLFSACAFAQQGFDTNMFKTKSQLKQLDKGKIKLDLAILVDNKEINDTSYTLNIVNYNTGILTTMLVSNKFILYLDYNNQYEISVSYKNTNTKAIIVDTDAPYDNWYIISGISLTSNSNNRILAGGIRYDGKLQTFKKYK
jgi:hypothetical protein